MHCFPFSTPEQSNLDNLDLNDFDLVIKLQSDTKPTELRYKEGNIVFSAAKICPKNSYLSIFTATCKQFQCPKAFHTVKDFCIRDYSNFSCSDHMFYADYKTSRVNENSTVSISNKLGNNFAISIDFVAIDGENLVVCANYSLWKMYMETRNSEVPVLMDALFIVSGICSTAFLTTAMALILITVRKNSFTLISFNILLTLFFENLAMFPRIFTKDGGYVCIISAIIDHYCWVVLFSWVCALAYEEMHSQKLNMFQLYSRPQTWLYMILCWLSPIILVMINTVMHFLQFDWLMQIYGGQSCSVR